MKITKLPEFQSAFNSELEKSNSQKFIIKNEIQEIENYINTIPKTQGLFSKPVKANFTRKAIRIFDLKIIDWDRSLFSDAFNGFMFSENFTSESLNPIKYGFDKINEEIVKQAFEFSEYYKWLDTLLTSPQKAEKKNALSHKEKMLALYYLGLDMRKFSNNKQSAIILSKILGLDESNTKDYLTYFDGKKCKVKTEPHMLKMIELFEHQDFKNIHSKIAKDLEK
jgi:hypothetical protein